MDFKKHNFDPVSATDIEWEHLDTFKTRMHECFTPNDPREPKEKRKQGLILAVESKEVVFEYFTLKEKSDLNTVFGIFIVSSFHPENPSYEANAALLMSEISLLPEYRNKGVAKELMNYIYEHAKSKNKYVIISNTNEKSSTDFIKHVGGIVAQTKIESRAYLKNIDWNMINEWIENGEKKNPNSKIEFFETVPDSLMSTYLTMFNETMNQIPKDEFAMEELTLDKKAIRDHEMGNTSLIALCMEPNGDISSLTELTHSPTKKQSVRQGFTSTVDKYRGRGLGKWVKAIMLRKAKNEFDGVEYISTHNVTSNAPMLHINNKIGFKAHKEAYDLQITVDQLGKYLNK